MADEFRLVSSPSPSGAEPPYPPNHTLDGDVTPLGSVANAGFEEEGSGFGSPIPNFDFETAPVVVASPTNADFETGDFTGWTTAGSPTIQTDPTHGYWARLTSGSQDITTGAVEIPQSAQALLVDVNFQGNGSWPEFYVLTGPNFETSTQIFGQLCSFCGWQTRSANVSAYQGQTVKFKLRARSGVVGFDAVRIQQTFPGYEVSGSFEWAAEGSDHYAKLLGGPLTTEAFNLAESAQFATVELRGPGTNSQYSVKIATGPAFSTWNNLAGGWAPSAWGQPISVNVSAYAGQQVKVRIFAPYNWLWVDDVFVQATAVPDWTIAGAASRLVDDGNHYVQTNGVLTSGAAQLDAGVQNVSLRLRSVSPTREAVLRGVTARNIARAHQEVLIEGFIPPSAITLLP